MPPPRQHATRTFSAASVRDYVRPSPDRIVLYGIEGIGKSTFGRDAPAPVFLDFDNGIGNLWPQPRSIGDFRTFEEVMDALQFLLREPQGETVVLDGIDHLEELIHLDVLRSSRKGMEWFNSYGAGLKHALMRWRRLLDLLTRINNSGQEIVLLLHAATEQFKNPAGSDYTRYAPNLAGKAARELIKWWATTVLFAGHETFVQTSGDADKSLLETGKAVGSGRRVLYTSWEASHDAKNRIGLPSELDMSPNAYQNFNDARVQARSSITPEQALLAEGLSLVRALELGEKARERFAAAEDKSVAVEWLRGLALKRAQAQEGTS